MYLPAYFEEKDPTRLARLIEEFPFGTLITPTPSQLWISHLPLLMEGEKIVGHMARANPHWRVLESLLSTAVFQGPHCYVSPTWYPNGGVPTWNYAVVHAQGRGRILEGAETLSLLGAMARKFEKSQPKEWDPAANQDLIEELAPALVAFEIAVEKIEGKFKLSQNRTPEEREGVLEALRGQEDSMSSEVLKWMSEKGASIS
jgi:transcriptional regulator